MHALLNTELPAKKPPPDDEEEEDPLAAMMKQKKAKKVLPQLQCTFTSFNCQKLRESLTERQRCILSQCLVFAGKEEQEESRKGFVELWS